MVGPDNEKEGAVRRMSRLFLAGARLRVPVVAIVLRKGYGLGAMAMTAGSFARRCLPPPGPPGSSAVWAWRAR